MTPHRIHIPLSSSDGSPTSSSAPPTPCNSEEEDERAMSSDDDDDDDEEEEEANFDEEQDQNNESSKTTSLKDIQDHESMEFPINGECTSLSLSPSGNFLWAGFSDGTLRVFDLTGNFGLEKDTAIASRQKSSLLVASKWCQTYGAVACQIHARGVHTDLITQVGVCDDEYVFCGVSRGAMELYAVDFGALEKAAAASSSAQGGGGATTTKKENILDYLRVHEKADAKLKGFGACTKLQNTSRPTYLLLTGKGIKNIHIWSFQPPMTSREDDEPIWTQLYDTQTNGNTILLLGFYRAPAGNKLLGVSKSDSQKLRLWDLSAEEEQDESKERPKRPPYVDVANSQAALGLAAGGFCVCGGPTMYNQLSIVSLDQPKNAYNHTELALPGAAAGGDEDIGRRSSSRRQRRGDLKQVVHVASPPEGDINAGQVLLELDEGTIVQYTMSTTNTTMGSASKLQILQPPTIPALPDDYWKRTICLGSSKHHLGALVVAMSLYNPNTSKGKLVLRKLPGTEQKASSLTLPHKSSNTMLQTPPHLQSTPPQQQPVISAAANNNGGSPETDLAAIKTLCMEPPSTSKKKKKKSKSSSLSKSSDGNNNMERIKSKKEKKKKRKKEKLLLEEQAAALKRRSSDDSSNIVVAESSSSSSSKKQKTTTEESSKQQQRVLSLGSLLEADTLIKTKEKVKKKKQATSEMVTPVRKSKDESAAKSSASSILEADALLKTKEKVKKKKKEAASEMVTPVRKSKDDSTKNVSTTGERIFVNRVKVIPLSAEKMRNKAGGSSSPSSSVGISSPSSEPDKKPKQGSEFETPARKNPNSSVTTAEEINTKTASLTQVSPDSSVVQKTHKPAKKTTGEMDRFVVVSQKQLKMPQTTTKDRPNKSKPSPELTQEQKEKQEQLKVASVPRKSRPNETVAADEIMEAPVDENVAPETEVLQEEVLVEEEEAPPEDVAEMKTNKVPSAKKNKRPRSILPSSNDTSDIKKRKTVRLDTSETDPKTPQPKKKFSSADSPPTREDIHATRVKAEYIRIQHLIAQLPAFVPALLRQGAPLAPPKSIQEAQARERSKLESKHRAAHEMIQRRMLRAAESIVRNVVDYHLSIDEARDELKGTVQSYQEVVHETLQRHKLEAETLQAQQIRGLGGLLEEVPSVAVHFPFQTTFEDIEDASRAIEAPRRLPGRPRNN